MIGQNDNGESIVVGSRILRTERIDVGMIRRQCTSDYKIVPIRRKVRELAGLTRRRSPKTALVEQWIGISLDEVLRMKPSFEGWQVNRWPLIERWMSRRDCLRWLEQHGYPLPPKSACIGCPFHSEQPGATSVIPIQKPGPTPSISTERSAPAFAEFGARSICTVPPYPSTRLT